jgi:hypothetical protein
MSDASLFHVTPTEQFVKIVSLIEASIRLIFSGNRKFLAAGTTYNTIKKAIIQREVRHSLYNKLLLCPVSAIGIAFHTGLRIRISG